MVRLDHFRGFESTGLCRRHARTAKKAGGWTVPATSCSSPCATPWRLPSSPRIWDSSHRKCTPCASAGTSRDESAAVCIRQRGPDGSLFKPTTTPATASCTPARTTMTPRSAGSQQRRRGSRTLTEEVARSRRLALRYLATTAGDPLGLHPAALARSRTPRSTRCRMSSSCSEARIERSLEGRRQLALEAMRRAVVRGVRRPAARDGPPLRTLIKRRRLRVHHADFGPAKLPGIACRYRSSCEGITCGEYAPISDVRWTSGAGQPREEYVTLEDISTTGAASSWRKPFSPAPKCTRAS